MMNNPFARPKEYLPSMTRHDITTWAHDIVDELRFLGALDAGNELFGTAIFNAYRNLEEFYIWVIRRPREATTQVPRPLQSIMTPRGIFARTQKLWDDLEVELQSEKPDFLIEQMIDHLRWLWNIKANLTNKIRREDGFSPISNMDVLAEAVKYAQSINNGHGRIIQNPAATPFPSSGYSLRAMAPASSTNPRNVGGPASGSSKRQEHPISKTMHSSQSFPFSPYMQNPKPDRLQPPQYPKYPQQQHQKSMSSALLAYNNAQSPRSPLSVQHQPAIPGDQRQRNLIDLTHDDNDDGLKYSTIPQVPSGYILPSPQIQGDRHPSRAQGFSGKSNRPIQSKPFISSGHVQPSLGISQFNNRDRAPSDGGMKHAKTEQSSSNRGMKESLDSSNKNLTVIVDSPSPESTKTEMHNPKPQNHKNHRGSPFVASEFGEIIERPRSTNFVPGAKTASLTGQARSSTVSLTPTNGQNNHRETTSAEPYITRGRSLSRRLRELEGISLGKSMGVVKSNTKLKDGKSGLLEDKNMGRSKPKRSAPTSGNQENITNDDAKQLQAENPTPNNDTLEDITENPHKKRKISTNHLPPVSGYTSPYQGVSTKARTRLPDKPTPLVPSQATVIDKPSSSGTGPVKANRPSSQEPTEIPDKPTPSGLVQGAIGNKHASSETLPVKADRALSQEQTDPPNQSTSLVSIQKAPSTEPVDTEPTSEKTISAQSVGENHISESHISANPENNKPLLTKTKSARNLYRPFSLQKSASEDNSGGK